MKEYEIVWQAEAVSQKCESQESVLATSLLDDAKHADQTSHSTSNALSTRCLALLALLKLIRELSS
jgi:hypothetical protein